VRATNQGRRLTWPGSHNGHRATRFLINRWPNLKWNQRRPWELWARISESVVGVRQMQEYRVYVIGLDGHIQERVDLFCADDDVAKERARRLVNGHDVELWQLDRRIATFKAKH
jgi:hypothetical protein